MGAFAITSILLAYTLALCPLLFLLLHLLSGTSFVEDSMNAKGRSSLILILMVSLTMSEKKNQLRGAWVPQVSVNHPTLDLAQVMISR